MFVKYNWINDLYINTKEWPLNVSPWEVIEVYNEDYMNLLSDFPWLFEHFDETSATAWWEYAWVYYISNVWDNTTWLANDPTKPFANYAHIRTQLLWNVVKEWISISFDTAVNTDENTYFRLFTQTNSYYVRFNKWTWVDPNPTLPTNSPQKKIWLEIDISLATTEADVATAVNAVLNPLSDVNSVALVWQVNITMQDIWDVKDAINWNAEVNIAITNQWIKKKYLVYYLKWTYNENSQLITLENFIDIYAEDWVTIYVSFNRIFDDRWTVHRWEYNVYWSWRYINNTPHSSNDWDCVSLRYNESYMNTLEAKECTNMQFRSWYSRTLIEERLFLKNMRLISEPYGTWHKYIDMVWCDFYRGISPLYTINTIYNFVNCTFSQRVPTTAFTVNNYDSKVWYISNTQPSWSWEVQNADTTAAICFVPWVWFWINCFGFVWTFTDCTAIINPEYWVWVRIVRNSNVKVWWDWTNTYPDDCFIFNNLKIINNTGTSNVRWFTVGSSNTNATWTLWPKVFATACNWAWIVDHTYWAVWYTNKTNLNTVYSTFTISI